MVNVDDYASNVKLFDHNFVMLLCEVCFILRMKRVCPCVVGVAMNMLSELGATVSAWAFLVLKKGF